MNNTILHVYNTHSSQTFDSKKIYKFPDPVMLLFLSMFTIEEISVLGMESREFYKIERDFIPILLKETEKEYSTTRVFIGALSIQLKSVTDKYNVELIASILPSKEQEELTEEEIGLRKKYQVHVQKNEIREMNCALETFYRDHLRGLRKILFKVKKEVWIVLSKKSKNLFSRKLIQLIKSVEIERNSKSNKWTTLKCVEKSLLIGDLKQALDYANSEKENPQVKKKTEKMFFKQMARENAHGIAILNEFLKDKKDKS